LFQYINIYIYFCVLTELSYPSDYLETQWVVKSSGNATVEYEGHFYSDHLCIVWVWWHSYKVADRQKQAYGDETLLGQNSSGMWSYCKALLVMSAGNTQQWRITATSHTMVGGSLSSLSGWYWG